MKILFATATALTVAAAVANAAGLDRSGQSIGVLFEQGRYGELSFGAVSPSVSGVAGPLLGQGAGFESGSVSPNFANFGAAYKADLNDTLSYALIYDQPFGAAVDYTNASPFYFANAAVAEFSSQALTGVLQYNLPSNVSVFGGLRLQEVEATTNIPFIDVDFGYDIVGSPDWGVGYVVGVAYEKPEIALRVALTYNSEIEHSLDTIEMSPLDGGAPRSSQTEIITPRSINLEFQSGVARDTLVFGSVRWVEWGDFAIAPADYEALTTMSLVGYAGDYTTWSLGVGRRLNDTWSIAATVGYEEPLGAFVNNLGPTDGFASVGIGATYTQGDMKITGGVRFIEVGDADTALPGIAPAGIFDGNTAVAAGIKVGFTF